MKYKHIISLFLFGVIFQLYGGLTKIMHEANADMYLHLSTYIMVASIIIAIVKLLTTKGKDNFLNK
jgi:hypothetical protein